MNESVRGYFIDTVSERNPCYIFSITKELGTVKTLDELNSYGYLH